jgi:hypothetical protein
LAVICEHSGEHGGELGGGARLPGRTILELDREQPRSTTAAPRHRYAASGGDGTPARSGDMLLEALSTTIAAEG